MLLGSTNPPPSSPNTEQLVVQLMMQNRYAEAYELLINQNPKTTASLYNQALCLHWSGNYQDALQRLESIQPERKTMMEQKPNSDHLNAAIRKKQNLTDDYLNVITEGFTANFPVSVQDAVIRLKTDCWLQLGEFSKVITIATPIEHKQYKNIEDALKIAREKNSFSDNKQP